MKKTLFLAFAVLIAAAATLSCSKFDKMSRNPYAIYEAPAEEYVHPIMFRTQYYNLSIFRNTTALLMQYAVNHNSENSARMVGNYNIPEGLTDDVWLAFYLQYGDAVKMEAQAIKDGEEAMQGVALILKAYLISQIADTYGEVPFREAAQMVLVEGEAKKYTTAYDSQKDIYYAIIGMLEDANRLIGGSEEVAFNSICDKTFHGDLDLWRRLGNSLYARYLMRVSMKVMEEDEGIIEFEGGSRPAFAVTDKWLSLYQSYVSGGGEYPMMRSRADRPMIPFDKNNETEQTPFYSITSGTWNALTACTSLCQRMLEGEYKIFQIKHDDGTVEKPFGDELLWQADVPTVEGYTGHAPDPRYVCWYKKLNGMPAHQTATERDYYYDKFRSKSGNFLGGSMTRGELSEPDPIWGRIHDLKNASQYAMMQYSELPFLFAEAGARGYIASLNNIGAVQSLLRRAVTESILEWNPYVTETSSEVVDYVNWVMTEELFSGFTINMTNALEAILTEKWIATFFIGIESWCDYRRTGYPLLKTNGSGARNDGILPTRLRYPSDEQYRNVEAYQAALTRWLGGENNIQTDVWWASTTESVQNRLKGRQ